jgi:hypothetical protein
MSNIMQRSKAQDQKEERMVCEDKSSEGRAHCRSVVGINGNIENLNNAKEKMRSLISHPIKKSDGIDHLMQWTLVI